MTFKIKYAVTRMRILKISRKNLEPKVLWFFILRDFHLRMRMWTHLRMRRRRRTGGWWRTTRKARTKNFNRRCGFQCCGSVSNESGSRVLGEFGSWSDLFSRIFMTKNYGKN
jgi:hypothetical protein